MRFAFVGFEDASLVVAQYLATTAHSVDVASCVGSYRERLAELFPSLLFTDEWETLIHGSSVDAVVIAASENSDPVRKLAQAGVPLLLLHPVSEAIVAYELNMVRNDTRRPMITWFPYRWQAGLNRVAQWTVAPEESPIGRVEQMVFDRAMQSDAKDEVLKQLARDMDWIAQMTGRPTNVHAVASHQTSDSLHNLSVTVQSDYEVLVRWSVTFGIARCFDSSDRSKRRGSSALAGRQFMRIND